jgi:hypothetical protein
MGATISIDLPRSSPPGGAELPAGRRTTTRRPPRRSALVAHPQPATANATNNPQGCPCDLAYDRSNARAALEAASSLRPEPLTHRPQKQRPQRCAGSVADRHTVLE